MPETNPTEKELLQKLKTGNRKAFRALFDQYYKYLVVTAFNVLGDSDSARDLAQDVFVEIWKKRDSLKITSSLKSYLRRAVVNKTLNHIKASRIDFADPVTLPEQTANTHGEDEKLHAADLEKIIHAAIANLPERCRIIFTLCRLEKLSHKEIAAQLDISTKTVENQMGSALKFLKMELAEYVISFLLLLILLSE